MISFFKKNRATDTAFLVVGLGNPGKKYEKTRHNVGFWAVQELAHLHGSPAFSEKFHSKISKTHIAGQQTFLLMPQTYMNLSGTAVAETSKFHKIPPERILVLLDDVNLAPGRLRVREKGSAGGHNGLKNIIGHIGTDTPRVRIGVGTPPPEWDLADWVTAPFGRADELLVKNAVSRACLAVEKLVGGAGFSEVMGEFNS